MDAENGVHGVEDLRKRIMQACNDFDQQIIDSAVREWRKRLYACVEAKGGQFEYKYIFIINCTFFYIACYLAINFTNFIDIV